MYGGWVIDADGHVWKKKNIIPQVWKSTWMARSGTTHARSTLDTQFLGRRIAVHWKNNTCYLYVVYFVTSTYCSSASD